MKTTFRVLLQGLSYLPEANKMLNRSSEDDSSGDGRLFQGRTYTPRRVRCALRNTAPLTRWRGRVLQTYQKRKKPYRYLSLQFENRQLGQRKIGCCGRCV